MRSALIDTNLLLLLTVGATNKSYIATHKRTKASAFTERDYEELLSILSRFEKLWVTSHCLAEASNLVRQTHPAQSKELLTTLSYICGNAKESHVPKDEIFRSGYYKRLGVADTGLIRKSKRVTCSLTTDLDLYLAITKLGREAINFNHLRARYLGPLED